MTHLVAYSTAFALCLHTVLGCCWHHGHTHAAEDRDVSVGVCAHATCTSHAGEHAHDHAANEESSPAAPSDEPGRHDCEGGKCAFVKDDATVRFSPGADCFGMPRYLPSVAACVESGEFQFSLARARPPGDSPPMRSHLLLQILLI